MTDYTRLLRLQQKKTSSVFGGEIAEAELKDFTGSHLIGYLPPNAMTTNCIANVKVAGTNVTAFTLGTTEGGSELMSSVDCTAVDITPAEVNVDTGSGTPVYITLTGADNGLPTGKFAFALEYIEYTLATGELTRVTN